MLTTFFVAFLFLLTGTARADNWFDLDSWKKGLQAREQNPAWEQELRDKLKRKIVGRVLECVGNCRVIGKEGRSNCRFRSKLLEGDDVETLQDSYLWIFLMDGTLVRLSPESLITFKEIDIGRDQIFHHARINRGNVLWLSRSGKKIINSGMRETDNIFLPLSLKGANNFAYHREKLADEDNHLLIEADKRAMKAQYQRLNLLIKENNKMIGNKSSFSFLSTGSGMVLGKNLQVELISFPLQPAYIKNRNNNNQAVDFFHIISDKTARNDRAFKLSAKHWYKIEFYEHLITKMPGSFTKFALGELLTRRIPTILTARELMLNRYSRSIFEGEPKKPEPSLSKRISHLKKTTRRLESLSNLVWEKFKKNLKAQGRKLNIGGYSPAMYRKALESL